MDTFLKRSARPMEALLGLVFLAGAWLKTTDINLFAVQIAAYGVIDDKALLGPTALSVLAIESLLGLSLFLGLRLRMVTYAFMACLLLFFTALIGYGWAFHALKDCGCFGPLEMSPAVSIGKNVLLLALAAVAWEGFRRRKRQPVQAGAAFLKLITAAGVAALLVYGAAHSLEKVDTEAPRPFAQFAFDTDFGSFDLGQGQYLVSLLSMGCEHCQAAVPELNALLYQPGIPPLVALCYEEFDGQIEDFRALTAPQFPMHSLGTQTLLFFNLLGDASEPPRLVWIRDGSEVKAWNGTMPTYEELLEAATGARAEYDRQ